MVPSELLKVRNRVRACRCDWLLLSGIQNHGSSKVDVWFHARVASNSCYRSSRRSKVDEDTNPNNMWSVEPSS